MADFNSLIEFYKKVQLGYYQYKSNGKNGKIGYISIHKNIKNYVYWLNVYDGENEGHTFNQIKDIIEKKSNTPMEDAMKDFDKVMSSVKSSNILNNLNNYRCAYKSFCETIIGRYNANVWLNAKFSKSRNNMNAYEMIAETAIFASPDIVSDLIAKGHPHACWFIDPNFNPYYIRDQKNVGKPTTDRRGRPCVGDRNQKANQAIKNAIYRSCLDVAIASIGGFCNYEACHIVPNSTNNRNYYTSIPNLCLIPRAIAGLSDHFQNIIDILNYHAITLYSLPYKKPTLSPSLMKIYSGLKWRVNYY